MLATAKSTLKFLPSINIFTINQYFFTINQYSVNLNIITISITQKEVYKKTSTEASFCFWSFCTIPKYQYCIYQTHSFCTGCRHSHHAASVLQSHSVCRALYILASVPYAQRHELLRSFHKPEHRCTLCQVCTESTHTCTCTQKHTYS